MWILWMLIVGLIVGAIARLLLPGRDPASFVVTSLIGVAGALIAGFLGRELGFYRDGEPAGFIASILGAVILLLAYRMLRRKA